MMATDSKPRDARKSSEEAFSLNLILKVLHVPLKIELGKLCNFLLSWAGHIRQSYVFYKILKFQSNVSKHFVINIYCIEEPTNLPLYSF